MTAVRLADGWEAEVFQPTEWMRRMVPEGEYVVMDGPYTLVLYPLSAEVPAPVGEDEDEEAGSDPADDGKLYQRYRIGGVICAGCYVGRADDPCT